MVNNSIKVYARIKNENKIKKTRLENYIISRSSQDFDDLMFHHSSSDIKFSYYQFRFHKVFDQLSSQNEIFEIVAKPVVSSVIHGFNGTIFAYGQTGSGKTYSITGCPKTYENRGIIPRCIEYIFEYLNQNPEAFTIHLSYLEIYNEIGYDLLNPKQLASKLEEFPRVILLEDGNGEAHLRNISIHAVSTEKDAMRLLFLGDTNRTIAETPMNDYSSRSHCIFTIYLTSQLKANNKTVRSKLHVVDLAGSERIGKSSITGNTLNEAKSINLSLHYLEQVISALSSSKKHVPFRNSMLTYLLKDSLCGNSLTTMLATLAVTRKNIEETISTCRFSKRVSMIKTQPIINEVADDSQQEINILQNEIYELKAKLLKYEGNSKLHSDQNLFKLQGDQKFSQIDEGHQEYYKNLVDDYLNYKLNVADLNSSEMKYCMEVMRNMYKKQLSLNNAVDLKCSEVDWKNLLNPKEERALPMNYSEEFKNNKISAPRQKYDMVPIKKQVPNRNVKDTIGYINTLELASSKCSKDNYTKKIEEYHDKLRCTYEEAKNKADIIEQCRQNIIILRTKMDQHRNMKMKEEVVAELFRYQNIYRKTILELRTLEKKTNHLKLGLLQTEMKRRRSGYSTADDSLSQSVDNAWQSNIGRIEPDVSLGTPNNSPSFDTHCSLNRCSETSTDYSFNDYNRPEKENEGTRTNSKIGDYNGCISSEYSRMESSSQFFLELLADDNHTLFTDELGPPQQKQLAERNRYPGWHKNNDVTETLNTSENKRPLRENLMNITEFWNPSLDEYVNRGEDSNISQIKPNRVTPSLQREIVSESFAARLRTEHPDKSDTIQHPRTHVNNNEESTISISKQDKNISYKESDSVAFREFIKSVPLTGDKEVDEEILNFYRSKFKN